MDTLFIFIGIVLGFTIAYFILPILNKTNHVPKADFDDLTKKFNDLTPSLKVAEAQILNLKSEINKIETENNSIKKELVLLQTKNSSLETNCKNFLDKLSDLNKSYQDEKELNIARQDEVSFFKEQFAQSKANFEALAEKHKAQKETNLHQADEINQLRDKINQFTAQNSTLIANNKALEEKTTTQKEEILEMQKSSHLQFEKIANQILEEKSGKFTESNKANIEALLKPLGENIENFKKKVEETYDKESKQRFSLEEKVKELVEQTNKVSAEANNLASALKGQSKKQGNWGEVILESILQKSGLVKDREYFLQKNMKGEIGNNLRPDVLVNLPDNRVIIIDSKVSLVSYDKFSSAETTEEQITHLNEHLRSLHRHIDDLSSKKYDNLETSLDFTMMFVPIEPAYLIAIQHDQELWAYAYEKRILLISPTNLIACLKLIADLWKREMQSKNALEIVNRGEKLYEKFVNFVDSIEEIGKHIDKTQNAYNNAVNQLKSGNGNLVGQALKLKELGLKSSKKIPSAMFPTDMEEEDELLLPPMA